MTFPTFPSESATFQDRVTGVTLRRLTDYLGHHNHLYFTNPGWYAGGRKLLVEGDRANRRNLFGIDLESGAIEQLTDGEPTRFQTAYVNPKRDEAYFWRERRLVALDLSSGGERPIAETEPDWRTSMVSVTADGRHVVTSASEPVEMPFKEELETGYVGFRERHAAMPLSRIYKAPVDGGRAEVVHEEDYWIGHVNASPAQANLITFCHEGPWDKVDQRIWGLDLDSGKTWKIRPEAPGEAIGHEYWLADGRSIGYHGRTQAGPVFGFIGHDNADHIEAPFPDDSQHFHSNARELVVGDGSGAPYLLLWSFDGERFSEARVLATHRGSRHIQRLHVHPRVSPDNRYVLYTSDHTGYGQVCLAEIPEDLQNLPTLAGLRGGR